MISVIVPVYNSELFVERCINSILAQTYSNFELILVDDGSTDHSLDVLKEYERRDPRITVIEQENSGPGLARNTGIEHATGDYIVFVDSDDIVKPDYFEKLSKENADIVYIDVDRVDERYHLLLKEHLSDYQSFSKDAFLRSQMTGKIWWGGVRKAVKSKLLMRNEIRFTEHKVGEEAIYSFLLMHYAESFSFIKGPVYEYVTHPGSQSDTRDSDPWGGVASAMKGKLLQMGLYDQYADTVNAFIATAAIISLDKMAAQYRWSEYRLYAKERIQLYRQTIDPAQETDLVHMKNKARFLYPFLKAGFIAPLFLASRLNRIIQSRIS